MKAPDKLYIGRRNYGPLIGGWESQPFTSQEIESIEYIRKEALLEWMKPLYEEYKKRSEQGEMVRQVAFTYKEVIDKINSI